MDNNLINVDDLVRQRLTGREEREPAGAWLAMRELLDKEEERKPVGFIWRRTLGGLAILVLISAISLGGYELSSSYKRSLGNSTPAIASADLSTNTHNNKNTITENSTIAPVVANEKTTGELNKTPKTTVNTGNIHNTPKSTTKENTTTPIATAATTTTSVAEPAHDAALAVSKPETTKANPTSENKTDNNGVAIKHDAEKHIPTPTLAKAPVKAHKDAAATKTHETVSSGSVAGTSAPANKPGENTVATTTSKPENTATSLTDTKTASDKASIASTKKETKLAANESEVATTNTAAKASDKKANKANNAGTANPSVDVKKPGTETKLATNTSAKHTGTAKTSGTSKNAKGLVTNNIPLAASVPATKKHSIASSITSVNSGKHITSDEKTDKPAIDINSKLTADGNSTTAIADNPVIKKANKPGGTSAATSNPTALKEPTGIVGTTKPATPAKSKKTIINTSTGKADNSNTTEVMISRGNKSIDRVNITERYIKISPSTYLLHLDTISIENINEEVTASDVASVEKSGPSNSAGEENDLTAKKGNTLAPNAAPPSENKAEEGSNLKEKSKLKKGGGHPFEPLQNAFNDIKYKINGTQFAMGLTGGINGTFFGPSSFNGFHFGATANFVFSESLNVMAELKYFHRANNGYTLNDNYSVYSLSGNGYTQQTMSQPFSFSTLQSFEMPFSVRYTKGKFNFFAGANLVYSFAINESQDMPVAGTTQSYPGLLPGNDTTGKIKASDFDARFGVGYLFGVSVQLSQNVSLDFRDVQTFWDNAHSAGAKEISSQLYRAPSFQISLGYRFGGKKSKDKE